MRHWQKKSLRAIHMFRRSALIALFICSVLTDHAFGLPNNPLVPFDYGWNRIPEDYIITDSTVNVRADHSVNAPVLTSVTFRQIVHSDGIYLAPNPPEHRNEFDQHPLWIRIILNNRPGYIAGEFAARASSCSETQQMLLCPVFKIFYIPYFGHGLSVNLILLSRTSQWNLSRPDDQFEKRFDYLNAMNTTLFFDGIYQNKRLIVTKKCAEVQPEGGSLGPEFCVLYFYQISNDQPAFAGHWELNITGGYAGGLVSDYSYQRKSNVEIDSITSRIHISGMIQGSSTRSTPPRFDFDYSINLADLPKYSAIADAKEDELVKLLWRSE